MEMREMNLGQGYQPGRGNSPADSVFNRALPNALTAKSDELFALARKNSLWTLSFGAGVLRYRDDKYAYVAPRFGQVRGGDMAVSEAGRRDDSGWHSGEEDGGPYQVAL